jgi:hypothetical protein
VHAASAVSTGRSGGMAHIITTRKVERRQLALSLVCRVPAS